MKFHLLEQYNFAVVRNRAENNLLALSPFLGKVLACRQAKLVGHSLYNSFLKKGRKGHVTYL
jgi:hypothetical protein